MYLAGKGNAGSIFSRFCSAAPSAWLRPNPNQPLQQKQLTTVKCASKRITSISNHVKQIITGLQCTNVSVPKTLTKGMVKVRSHVNVNVM